VMMPGLDGFEVCRRLRTDIRTSFIPVIILTAKSMTVDKVVGLTAGADDYVLKPFDPLELVARVRTTLRRARELRATSPLTGLPGNHVIERELARRHSEGEPVALVYADLNDFKSFNDRYGFLRGDEVIRMTAEVLQQAVADAGGANAFVGHIGGDDFMIACDPQSVLSVCQHVIRSFDCRIEHHYEPEDWARGYLELPDRQGGTRRWPRVSIAMGVATTRVRTYRDHREIVATATEMKSYLKLHYRRSAYAIDGRAGETG
jgi:diguanylate cyclase (GGDEF)-like protein